MTVHYEFGSDNHSGVHPNIMKAIESANKNCVIAYGDDKYTKRAVKKFKEHFGNNIEVFAKYFRSFIIKTTNFAFRFHHFLGFFYYFSKHFF